MSQTKAELIKGLNINASAPATALNIDSSGRVGIGTTSPQSLLHLETDGTALRIVRGSAIGFAYNTGTAATDPFRIQSNGGPVDLFSAVGQPITFSAGTTEKARVDGSGRLLVGTSTARNNFFNTTQSANIQLEGIIGTALMSLVANGDSAGGNAALILGKTRGTAVGSTTVVQSGDVLGRITFQGSDGTEFVQAADIYAEVDGTPGANDMPGRLVFATTADGASSPTERIRINQGGAFKATTNGSYSLSVNTLNHEFNQSNSARTVFNNSHGTPFGLYITYSAAAPNNTDNEFIYCQDSGGQRARILSNGGLANFQANNVNLSDRNTKKDISPAADTWDCIKEWEIVNYRYKDQPDAADLSLGVIAQQVAESCPEVITVFEKTKDDQPEKLGIKEQQMYWMAIKALQEAQVRIEQLEQRLADAGIA